MTLRPALLAALLSGVVLSAGAAQAQINPFKTTKGAPQLDDSDLPLLEQAGSKLLAETAPARGASETWRNEATGAAGTVTFLGPTHRTVRGQTYACRRLQYDVTLKDRPTPRTTRVAWCQLPDGAWKIV